MALKMLSLWSDLTQQHKLKNLKSALIADEYSSVFSIFCSNKCFLKKKDLKENFLAHFFKNNFLKRKESDIFC